MTIRRASCACGQLTLVCTGAPERVSVCHCLECKRRSGSAFAYQARWPESEVTFAGRMSHWTKSADNGSSATFCFCPDCGGSVAYRAESLPGLVAVPVGTFADPQFPAPEYSVFEERMPEWLGIVGPGIDHYR